MVTVLARLEQWEQHCLNRLLLRHEVLCISELSEGASELQRGIEAGLAVCRTYEQVQTVFAAARYLAPTLERGELWNENQHPRDKDGKWTHGSGSSAQSVQLLANLSAAKGKEPLSPHDNYVGSKIQQELNRTYQVTQARLAHLEGQRATLETEYNQRAERHQSLMRTLPGEQTPQHQLELSQAKRETILAASRHQKKVQEAIGLEERTRQSMFAALCSAHSLNLTPQFEGRINTARQEIAQQGFEAASQLMGDLPYLGRTVTVRPEGKSRGLFDTDTEVLKVGHRDGTVQVVHELGHWLEHNDPTVLRKAIAFYERRTKGEVEQPLRKLDKGKKYTPDEKAKPDCFIDPYMGKVYRDEKGTIQATEIISMGLQLFYEDPGALATQDGEYFDFVYSIIHPTTRALSVS